MIDIHTFIIQLIFFFQFVFDVAGLIDSVMISLEQRDVTAAKQIGQKLLRIGFQIFKVCRNDKILEYTVLNT